MVWGEGLVRLEDGEQLDSGARVHDEAAHVVDDHRTL